MTPPLPKRTTGNSGRASFGDRRTAPLLNLKRFGIWSVKTKGWLYTQPSWNNWKPIDCVFKTKVEANRTIKNDLVHEKDYEVREYK